MQGSSRTKDGELQLSAFVFLSDHSHAESLADIKDMKAMQVKLKNRQLKSVEAHKQLKCCKVPHAEYNLEEGLPMPSVVCKGMRHTQTTKDTTRQDALN